jgi:hypothetical protein
MGAPKGNRNAAGKRSGVSKGALKYLGLRAYKTTNLRIASQKRAMKKKWSYLNK